MSLRVFSSLILLSCLVFLSACAKKGIPAPQGGSDMTPAKVNLRRSVELTVVEQKALTSSIDAIGVIEAESLNKIASGLSGLVEEVLFREGDLVDPRQKIPLIRIDRKRYLAAYEVAKANEKEAQAVLLAAADANRRAQAGGAAVAIDVRQQAAEAESVAEARLASAKANLIIAKLNADRSEVFPPCRGQINTRTVAVGDYVDEKTVIATVADLSKLRVSAYLPESVEPLIRKHMQERSYELSGRLLGIALAGMNGVSNPLNQILIETAEIPSSFDPQFTVPPFPNRIYRGHLFYLSRVADPTTHMFETKTEIDPRTFGFNDLSAGYTARIRFPLKTNPDALVIPEEALRATERGFIVFVPEKRIAKDGSVEWIARPKRVEVGTRAPGWVEIRQGLSPKQAIVKRGAEALEDGTPIRFNESQQKIAEGK